MIKNNLYGAKEFRETLESKIPYIKKNYFLYQKQYNKIKTKPFLFLNSRFFIFLFLLMFLIASGMFSTSFIYPIMEKPFASNLGIFFFSKSLFFFVLTFVMAFLKIWVIFHVSGLNKSNNQLWLIYANVFNDLAGLKYVRTDLKNNLDYKKLIKKNFSEFIQVTYLTPILVFNYKNIKNIRMQIVSIEAENKSKHKCEKRSYEYLIAKINLDSKIFKNEFAYQFKSSEIRHRKQFYATPDHYFNKHIGLVTNKANFSDYIDLKTYEFWKSTILSPCFRNMYCKKESNKLVFSFESLGPSLFLLWYEPELKEEILDQQLKIIVELSIMRFNLIRAFLLPLILIKCNNQEINNLFVSSSMQYFVDKNKLLVKAKNEKDHFFNIHHQNK